MNKLIFFFLSAFLLIFSNCTENGDSKRKSQAAIFSSHPDVHSYAKPQEAVTKHLSLNLKVNFENQQLTGFAKWYIQNNKAKHIILDVKDLSIEKVTIEKGGKEEATNFVLSPSDSIHGAALSIDIQENTEILTIYYATNPGKAEALGWMEAIQTKDKKYPFLFTQGQAILTRSWIPCQDSPGIRVTYDAAIQVQPGMMAVMSAENPQKTNETGLYQFKMEQPISPYLIALAAGGLEFKSIGARTGIYAEPSLLESAVYEFGDMENMLIAAEELYGKYLWERYDVIVLPPSFPFGGMENPRLTFATPTIIAGDRSLTALIAHELAHSWSGNLVTNATWDDFWLNEGFTVYFEKRIMEKLYGVEYEGMLATLGYQDLLEDVEDLGPESADTHLKLNLEGRHPDDGMNDIAYEKGSFFLEMLETAAGREKFDDFIKNYFHTHQFQTLNTEDFITYLNKNLIEKYNLEVNIDEWVYGPGIPENIPHIASDKFNKVDEEVAKVVRIESPLILNTQHWTTHEWLHFIRSLPPEIDVAALQRLDLTFHFSDSGNSEIKSAWYQLAIKNGYSSFIIPKIEAFLVEVGRRKFLKPIYSAFIGRGQRTQALMIYEKARPYYHAISRGTIDGLLNWEGYMQSKSE